MRSGVSVSPPLQLALGLLAAVLVAGVATVVALVHPGPIGEVPLAYALPALGAPAPASWPGGADPPTGSGR